MTFKVSDWQTSKGCGNRYSAGAKYRQITYDCVTCSQYIAEDGVKHYEFFNAQTKYKIDDFSSPQMQAVNKILYYIQNEEKFHVVEEKGK